MSCLRSTNLYDDGERDDETDDDDKLMMITTTTTMSIKGRVRLTLFRNKNTWSDDENGMFGAFQSSKDNKNMGSYWIPEQPNPIIFYRVCLENMFKIAF